MDPRREMRGGPDLTQRLGNSKGFWAVFGVLSNPCCFVFLMVLWKRLPHLDGNIGPFPFHRRRETPRLETLKLHTSKTLNPEA